jgi:hypothetical protein
VRHAISNTPSPNGLYNLLHLAVTPASSSQSCKTLLSIHEVPLPCCSSHDVTSGLPVCFEASAHSLARLISHFLQLLRVIFFPGVICLFNDWNTLISTTQVKYVCACYSFGIVHWILRRQLPTANFHHLGYWGAKLPLVMPQTTGYTTFTSTCTMLTHSSYR